jgi:hypothetical protein
MGCLPAGLPDKPPVSKYPHGSDSQQLVGYANADYNKRPASDYDFVKSGRYSLEDPALYPDHLPAHIAWAILHLGIGLPMR